MKEQDYQKCLHDEMKYWQLALYYPAASPSDPDLFPQCIHPRKLPLSLAVCFKS